MVGSAQWFAGDEPTEAREQAFVEALRVVASTWSFTDLDAAHTSTAANEIGRLVEVKVPSLTTSRRTLRILYDVDVDGPPALQSEWTAFGYPFEGPGYEQPDPETDLWVSGVDASPQQFGAWAGLWFERQLRRPVRRVEWDRPASGLSTLIPGSTSEPAFVRWMIDNPQQQLDERGGLKWWWLQHQPPSREVWERLTR
ncbi:hypothetical protein [Microlunatus antarcticus]|uniref:Uncharacterized protein n=1 Tax=Microlunatus antarcticus TaxID=53388 RepID=A0A7W5P6C9_9ACTN|nr:hypothetical protein [Microlunatus antarcticus]MBB3326389.1 hypothetical protein [Microlunatus antarcticus]